VLISQLEANRISDDSDEDGLAKRIAELWSSDRHRQQEIRQNKDEIEYIRAELAQDLFRFKKVLAKSGRGGMWSDFLRRHRIPRSTADRYVSKVEAAKADANCPTEAIFIPTAEQIAALVKKTRAKVVALLTTDETRAKFLDALASSLKESPKNSGV